MEASLPFKGSGDGLLKGLDRVGGAINRSVAVVYNTVDAEEKKNMWLISHS